MHIYCLNAHIESIIMKHTLTITQQDHIAFQLYEASTNPLKKKARKRSYYSLIIIVVCLMIISYLGQHTFLFYYAFFCSLLSIFFGQLYLRWRHKRHYVKHVKNNFKDSDTEDATFEIDGEVINIEDRTGESKLKIQEIRKIDETGNHYFIRIGPGPVLIIPKVSPELNTEMKDMISAYKIDTTSHLDWKWK